MKFTDFTDTLTPDGAQHLKDSIEHYWHTRGYAVHVRAVPLDIWRDKRAQFCGPNYVIRSDMVNGFPVARI